MRPSPRLIRLVLALLAATALALALPALPVAAVAAVWAALGLAALADLVLCPGKRAVLPVLDGPAEVFAGETLHLTLRLSGRPVAGARALLAAPAGLGVPEAPTPLPHPAGAAQLPIRAERRGTFALGPLWLTWTSPLALFEAVPAYRLERDLAVLPNIRPVTEGVIDTAIRSELYGIKENRVTGDGSEFHQLRDFTAGMDTRSIDWKHSARSHRLIARETRAERNHQILLAIDTGHLMREEVAGLAKLDHAIHAALAMAWAAGIGGDLAGLYTYHATPQLYLPPAPGRLAFQQMRAKAASLTYESAESNPTLCLMHLAGRLNRRSLVVVFSDFVDTTTAALLIENLAVMGKRHVLLFVAVKDPTLTDRPRPSTLDAMAEAVAAAEMVRERRVVFDRLARMGVTVIEALPGALTPRLLGAYLTIKAREVI